MMLLVSVTEGVNHVSCIAGKEVVQERGKTMCDGSRVIDQGADGVLLYYQSKGGTRRGKSCVWCHQCND